MNFEQEILKIQDTLVVMAEIQRPQAEVRKIQAAEFDAMRETMRKGYELHEKRMAHIRQNLDEFTNKLNSLIGFTDGFSKRQQ